MGEICGSLYTFERNPEGNFEPAEEFENYRIGSWLALYSLNTENGKGKSELHEIGAPNYTHAGSVHAWGP
jgi:hypothetical protein